MSTSNKLERIADRLIQGKRKTRRGKKKPAKNAKWTKEFNEAMKLHNQMKKERAQEFQNFARLIEKE